MYYFCSTCTNRVEGKLDIEVIIACKTCGRYYTLAELIEYNSTVELRTASFRKSLSTYISKLSFLRKKYEC